MKSLPCKDSKATILPLTLSSHNLPTGGARELLKLSKEAKHLLGSFFKNPALLCSNIFRCNVTTGEVWKFLMT